MPIRDSRRQRQQLRTCGDMALLLLPRDEDELEPESEELLDDVLPRCCSGSAVGRWAAAVCSCSRREASPEFDIDSWGDGWMANRG